VADQVDVDGLRRTAYLLCGDWPEADEVVYRALTTVAAGRRRPDPAVLRAALVRCWRSRPEPAGAPVDVELVRALRTMPPRQRGCVVLRYWERCPVEETARLLGCSAAEVHRDTTEGLRILLGPRAGSDRKPG
jgi:DNA-directed RNA polymerase specialized sigma24 family protein